MTPLTGTDPAGIGEFELLGRLGAGGMGQLYLGRRDGSPAAVKAIRPDLANQPGFRERFRREITAARQAGSAYTAGVLDADPDGASPWLALEYIAGPSVTEAVAAHGTLPEPAARALMAGLCAGLVHLHGLGLVHRDLTPGNVLLTADGPRIIDFGVSRVVDSSTITQTGQLLGSPGFMSPEQAVGRDTIGPAADIFALGSLIAYALTGESPFGTGQTHAVVYRLVHEQPSLDAIPESLRGIIASCLAKEPADRPPAQDLRDRLGAADPAGDWLPAAITADISARTAELARLLTPQPHTMIRTPSRPPVAAVPASPPPAPRRVTGRIAVLAGAAAVVLAAGAGTALALNQETPAAAPARSATPSPSATPSSVRPSVTVSPAAAKSSLPPPPSAVPAASTVTVVAPRPQQPTEAAPTVESTTKPPAKASPTPEKATASPKPATRPADGQTCFNTAVTGGFDLKADVHKAGGPNFTSSKCRDIHIKLTYAEWATYARSCLETPQGAITTCSRWVRLRYPDIWDTLSVNVPAGTRWQLQMWAEGDHSPRFSYTA